MKKFIENISVLLGIGLEITAGVLLDNVFFIILGVTFAVVISIAYIMSKIRNEKEKREYVYFIDCTGDYKRVNHYRKHRRQHHR